MYHYIGEADENSSSLHYLELEDFKKQLDYFRDNFGFVTRDDWQSVVNGKSVPAQSDRVLLTFDDGLKCHYKHVLPELLKRNLWGLFFVSTGPFRTSKLLNVHAAHLLLYEVNPSSLLIEMQDLIPSSVLDNYYKAYTFSSVYSNHSDEHNAKFFKFLINYCLEPDLQNECIERLAKTFAIDLSSHDFYMSAAELRELAQNGNIIGCHSVNHLVMSNLNRQKQEEEIAEASVYFKQGNFYDELVYCHPFGIPSSYNEITLDILSQHNCAYAFAVKSQDFDETKFKKERFVLPRYDCNEYPHGVSALDKACSATK